MEKPKPPQMTWTVKYNHYSNRNTLVDFTPEKLPALQLALEAYRQQYASWAKAAKAGREEKLNAVVEAAVAAGASAQASVPKPGSRTGKREIIALKNALLPFVPSPAGWSDDYSAERAVERLIDATKAVLRDEHSKEREEQRSAEAAALATDAVKWLLERGKTIGTDFTVADAVVTANRLAFNEWLAKHVTPGTFFGFDGQNCEGPCKGWDGESRRCACGNRRVSWESTGSFREPVWARGGLIGRNSIASARWRRNRGVRHEQIEGSKGSKRSGQGARGRERSGFRSQQARAVFGPQGRQDGQSRTPHRAERRGHAGRQASRRDCRGHQRHGRTQRADVPRRRPRHRTRLRAKQRQGLGPALALAVAEQSRDRGGHRLAPHTPKGRP